MGTRRGWLVAVALTLGAAGPGCEASQDADDAAGADAEGDSGAQATGPFRALVVRDAADYACSVNQRAHGADIDAVELLDPDGKRKSWWTKARASFGDGARCDLPLATRYKDARLAQGSANATLDEGYVALAGGWVMGEFNEQQEILAGDSVVVHEVGLAVGGKDEPYTVHLATDLACDPDAGACTRYLGEATGRAELVISGF